MMAKRAKLPESIRWQVFARDGFRCRYCGVQAGDDGVTLHADHLVSVVDGGTNAMDNLITACQRCNGGKGARTLVDRPADISPTAKSASRVEAQAEELRRQAAAIAAMLAAQEDARQEVVNMLCMAYDRERLKVDTKDLDRYVLLCRRHGADQVYEWLCAAANRGVVHFHALRYVHGIIRSIINEEAHK